MLHDVQRYVQNHGDFPITICYSGLSKLGQSHKGLDTIFLRYGLITGMENKKDDDITSKPTVLVAPDVDYGMESMY